MKLDKLMSLFIDQQALLLGHHYLTAGAGINDTEH
jgi:hypothetical protein